MSALIAVASPYQVHLLTDAASVRAVDGVVAGIAPKQFIRAIPGVAIATTGRMDVCAAWTALAKARCDGFDALVDAAETLWAQAQEAVAPMPGVSFAVVFAGWSDRRRLLEMRSLDSHENALTEDLSAIATGPCDEAFKATSAFVDRFSDCPEAFVPERDGVNAMEELRRYRRQFEGTHQPCVGGWVQATVLTREDIVSRVIHRWPDRIGEAIHLEAA